MTPADTTANLAAAANADTTADLPKPADTTADLPKAADTTANLRLRGERARASGAEAVDKAAQPDHFQWPAPPYYEFTGPKPPPEEECLLIFRDGTKSVGLLHGFSPDEMTVRFQQGTSAILTIAFSNLQRLELLWPVAMQRQRLPETMQERVFAPSDRQPFVVDTLDGKQLQGDTVGYIEALCGLFLFSPDKGDLVQRQFIPADAMTIRSIGKPIGEMLVDQNLASQASVDAAVDKQKNLRARRLGEFLTEHQIVSPEQLNAALRQQRANPVQKLGDALVELGYLKEQELKDALAIEKRNRSIPLGQILADMGVVDAQILNGVMAQKLGIPFVNLQAFPIAPEILKRIPAALARRYKVVPLAESDNGLAVAVQDPMNLPQMDQLRFVAGSKLIPVMAAAEDIALILERHYSGGGDSQPAARGARKDGHNPELPLWRDADPDLPIEELMARLASETGDVEAGEHGSATIDTTLVKLVNKIILDAVEQKASDIHVETNSGGRSTRVRFRKDGALMTYLELPARQLKAVVSRLKIMAQLDITERRKPQDGKIDFSRFGPARVDLRVATIPTSGGLEDVVMRILSAAKPVPLEQLGFDAAALEAVKRLISRPHGLFLTCGPTGSGKTTTLHSLLSYLNTAEKKIWTAEDPIEIAQPGLRQVQVNPKIGWTFANAMRSFMRGDPDVIMVGEMRDPETAKIGIEASLTGHLVLSTLHTNSAAESVVRLLDLGMEPFNFADALLGVLAQRLVRQLCPKCKKPYAAGSSEIDELVGEYCSDTPAQPAAVLASWRGAQAGPKGGITLYQVQGCAYCDGAGYKGRIGVYELLVADRPLKRLVQTRAPVSEISAAAMANGMRTLKQDGITKVLQGLTDIRQVRAV